MSVISLTLFLASLLNNIDFHAGHLESRVAVEQMCHEGEVQVVSSFSHV